MDFRSLVGWGLPTGVRAPEFSLMGADTKLYTLSQFRGRKVLLYFFPRVFTSGCTAQACSFRSDYSHLIQLGYTVLGISTDALSAMQSFKDKYALPFPLLSDVSQRVCRDYAVRLPVGIANRVTFLIDADGIIQKTFRFLPWENYAQALLRETQK